jgi:hypothetical protein
MELLWFLFEKSLLFVVHIMREHSLRRSGLLSFVIASVTIDTVSSAGLVAVKSQPPDLAVALTNTSREHKS